MPSPPHRAAAFVVLMLAIFPFGWLMYGTAGLGLGFAAGLLVVVLLANLFVQAVRRRTNL